VAIKWLVVAVVDATLESLALLDVGDDAHGERVAADAGEVFAEEVGRSVEVAGGGGADYLDVMAFPVHRAAADAAWRCCGDGVEIRDGETERRIGGDCETERRHCAGGVRGLLSLAVEGGGWGVGCHDPTVVVDRGVGERWLAMVGGGLFWVLVHDCQGGPVA
jgi:hypothetical protein